MQSIDLLGTCRFAVGSASEFRSTMQVGTAKTRREEPLNGKRRILKEQGGTRLTKGSHWVRMNNAGKQIYCRQASLSRYSSLVISNQWPTCRFFALETVAGAARAHCVYMILLAAAQQYQVLFYNRVSYCGNKRGESQSMIDLPSLAHEKWK